MRDFLIDIINHRFVFTFLAVILVVTGFVTLRDGFQITDLALLILVACGCVGLWRVLLTNRTEGVNDILTFERALKNNQIPTLVEFYSPYCAGCMAVKPLVDRIENDAGNKLQVIRLNIDQEPGMSLMQPYGVIFTPTFLYFDKSGERVRDSMFVVDRAKILRDIGLG